MLPVSVKWLMVARYERLYHDNSGTGVGGKGIVINGQMGIWAMTVLPRAGTLPLSCRETDAPGGCGRHGCSNHCSATVWRVLHEFWPRVPNRVCCATSGRKHYLRCVWCSYEGWWLLKTSLSLLEPSWWGFVDFIAFSSPGSIVVRWSGKSGRPGPSLSSAYDWFDNNVLNIYSCKHLKAGNFCASGLWCRSAGASALAGSREISSNQY